MVEQPVRTLSKVEGAHLATQAPPVASARLAAVPPPASQSRKVMLTVRWLFIPLATPVSVAPVMTVRRSGRAARADWCVGVYATSLKTQSCLPTYVKEFGREGILQNHHLGERLLQGREVLEVIQLVEIKVEDRPAPAFAAPAQRHPAPAVVAG